MIALFHHLTPILTGMAAVAHRPAKSKDTDAELIALCAEFHAAQAEMDALDQEAFYDGDPRIDRECDLVDRCLYIREDLAAMTPTTPEALAAKASVILSDLRGQEDPDSPSYDPRVALARSLARDVVGRAGA